MPEDLILVRCPQCDGAFDVPRDLVGLPVTCKACDHRFTPAPPSKQDLRLQREREKEGKRRAKIEAKEQTKRERAKKAEKRFPATRHSAARAILRRLRNFTLRGWLVTVAVLLVFLILAGAGLNLALIHFWAWYYLLFAITTMVCLLFVDLFILLFVSVHGWCFSKSHPRIRRRGAWLVAGLGACLPLYAITIWREGLLEFFNYSVILGFMTLSVFIARLTFAEHKAAATAASIGLVVVLFFVHAWADRSTSRWVSKDTRTTYDDTLGRFTSRWNHRRMRFPDDHATYWFWEGPMSASWKPHGRWEYHHKLELTLKSFTDKALSDFLSDDRYHWYWYGEKITEGEWHLRNK